MCVCVHCNIRLKYKCKHANDPQTDTSNGQYMHSSCVVVVAICHCLQRAEQTTWKLAIFKPHAHDFIAAGCRRCCPPCLCFCFYRCFCASCSVNVFIALCGALQVCLYLYTHTYIKYVYVLLFAFKCVCVCCGIAFEFVSQHSIIYNLVCNPRLAFIAVAIRMCDQPTGHGKRSIAHTHNNTVYIGMCWRKCSSGSRICCRHT